MTSDADTPDFPALVELANRLEGKDRKTCELALYTLKKQDERLAKRDARISDLEATLNNIKTILHDENVPTPLFRVCCIQDALEGK